LLAKGPEPRATAHRMTDKQGRRPVTLKRSTTISSANVLVPPDASMACQVPGAGFLQLCQVRVAGVGCG
jgi:hypothetical protein